MPYSILIIDKMHPSIIELLQKIGLKVDYLPEIKRTEILDIIQIYGGIIVRSKTEIDEEFLAKAYNLKFIARAGSGLDLIDIDAVRKRDIIVFNAPEGNRDAVAEQTIGMLLGLLHKISVANEQVRNNIWNRESNRGTELKGKTVSIIGYGNVGKEFAKRLKGFDCQVLAYDKYAMDYSDEYAKEATMQQIFAESDIVSLHIPLTEETRNLVNEPYLQSFKKNIILINTARGELVVLKALKKAIENAKVFGACLDVLENEKLNTLTQEQKETFDFLKDSDKVILTPHIAGWTFESYERINRILIEKIKDFLRL